MVEQLQEHGFDAYVVGGAVRDLLIGKHPKDFDVATNALLSKSNSAFAMPGSLDAAFRSFMCGSVGRSSRSPRFAAVMKRSAPNKMPEPVNLAGY